ncbi:hypothetical protein HK099_003910 [Clydaea vesicula]|uniref:RING-type domain-containing protein n=1 Tax=Clydaea vesicula TaxID=447962 RepID=A0AAD5Y0L6_9FUNG|nr:hypothetical protein HK099_003910 [Clydaea vesicula]
MSINVSSARHLDLACTSMSISPTGNQIVLAAKKGLYVVDLEDSSIVPRFLKHASKWVISPPSKPVNSVCAWTAGATQVKWNRKNEWLLASSHDSDLRIWDIRKGTTPITLITAHMNKIYGIDWSWNKENEIVTCGQDRFVKFWDLNQPRLCQSSIITSSPVWRARYTPFGDGIITMPQRKDTHLSLWRVGNVTTPVFSFVGHSDVPREFVWRIKGKSNDYDDVKFWPINSDQLHAVGHNTYQQSQTGSPASDKKFSSSSFFEKSLIKTPSSGHLSPSSSPTTKKKRGQIFAADLVLPGIISESEFTEDRKSSDSLPTKLLEKDSETDAVYWFDEIMEMSRKYPNIQIDKINQNLRTCTISLQNNNDLVGLTPENLQFSGGVSGTFLRFEILFPANYPSKYSIPKFEILKSSMMSMIQRNLVKKKLSQISIAKMNNIAALYKGGCLEDCFTWLINSKGGLINVTENNKQDNSKLESRSNFKSDSKVNNHSDSPSPPTGHELLRNKKMMILEKKLNSNSNSNIGMKKKDDFSVSSSSEDNSISTNSSSEREKRVFSGIGANFGLKKSKIKKSSTEEAARNNLNLLNSGGELSESGNSNCPYPKLCSASFSQNGKLVLFFSPLQHPSKTKFTQNDYTTKSQSTSKFSNQQKVYFDSQPKLLRHYAKYREFLEEKNLNRESDGVDLTRENTSNPLIGLGIYEEKKPKNVSTKAKFDDWFATDEDSEEEEKLLPSLFWRPKGDNSLLSVPVLSNNFLVRLHKYKIGVQSSPKSASSPYPQSSHSIHSAHSATEGKHSPLHCPGDRSTSSVESSPKQPNSSNNKHEIIDLNASITSNKSLEMELNNNVVLGTPPNWRSTSTEENRLIPAVFNNAEMYTSPGSNSFAKSHLQILTQKEMVLQPGSISFSNTLPFGTYQSSELNDSFNVNWRRKSSQDSNNGKGTLNETGFGAIYSIVDCRELLPVSEALADNYQNLLGNDSIAVCNQNKLIADKFGRKDLVKIWGLVELILEKIKLFFIQKTQFAYEKFCSPYNNMNLEYKKILSKYIPKCKLRNPFSTSANEPSKNVFMGSLEKDNFWGEHPFGKKLVKELLDYCESIGDFQTYAILICIFLIEEKNINSISNFSNSVESQKTNIKNAAAIFTAKNDLSYAQRVSKGSNYRDLNVTPSSSTTSAGNFVQQNQLLETYHSGLVDSNKNRKSSSIFSSHNQNIKPDSVYSSQKTPVKTSSVQKNTQVGGNLLFELNETKLSFLNFFFCEKLQQKGKIFLKKYSEYLFNLGKFEKLAEISKFIVAFSAGLYETPKTADSLKKSITCTDLNGKNIFFENLKYDTIKCEVCVVNDNKFKNCINCGVGNNLVCCLCRRHTKGLSYFCFECGHGGHLACMKEWFSSNENIDCPSGCGCHCN